MPTCSQLDFLRLLIQSEAVSFCSILQPISHAGNKTPDLVPSSRLLKSLWPGKSGIWNFLYERRHRQPSTSKFYPFFHVMGGHVDLVWPCWHQNYSCFHTERPPFHSACAKHWAVTGVIPINPYAPHYLGPYIHPHFTDEYTQAREVGKRAQGLKHTISDRSRT